MVCMCDAPMGARLNTGSLACEKKKLFKLKTAIVGDCEK